uniref:Uncharacterized protein n=1 Tax=Romanomermis culicivorax TaxID=13658 RepID=A0A915JCA6_ROMCU
MEQNLLGKQLKPNKWILVKHPSLTSAHIRAYCDKFVVCHFSKGVKSAVCLNSEWKQMNQLKELIF